MVRSEAQLQIKELANLLKMKPTQIKDVLRFKTSLRDALFANKMLLLNFGVRPDTVWGDGVHNTPLTICSSPFTSLWYHAWGSTSTALGTSEPVVLWLARMGVISERKVNWFNDRYLAALDRLRTSTAGTASVEEHHKKVTESDPIFRMSSPKIFDGFPSAALKLQDIDLLAAAQRYSLRGYEQFFPRSNRSKLPHDSF